MRSIAATCWSTGVRLPFVQYVASLAIVQAVQDLARERLQVPSHPTHSCMHACAWPDSDLWCVTLLEAYSDLKRLQDAALPVSLQHGLKANVSRGVTTKRDMVQGQGVDVRIKWPNDVYGNRLKIGGILCQSVYRDQAFHVVIGTGINLSNRHPTTCIDALIEEQHKELSLPGTPATIQPEVTSLLLWESGASPQ